MEPLFVKLAKQYKNNEELLKYVDEENILNVWDFIFSLGKEHDINDLKSYAQDYCDLSFFGDEVIDLYIKCKKKKIKFDKYKLFELMDKNEALNFLNKLL